MPTDYVVVGGVAVPIITVPNNMMTTDTTQTGLIGDKTSGGTWKAGVLSAAGLPGATSATRWVGSTTSGAPATGTWQQGDFIIAQNGYIWICTVAGTPGTWVVASGTPATTVTDETAWGSTPTVGVSTNYARQDHSHGTQATPATSVAGRTGAVTLTAADISAGSFPVGSNSMQAPTSGVALTLKTAITTPGDIQQWQDSASVVLARVTSAGQLTAKRALIVSDSTTQVPEIQIQDTKSGQATPHKFIRSYGGNLEVINSAYSLPILQLTDTGNLSSPGWVRALRLDRCTANIANSLITYVDITGMEGWTLEAGKVYSYCFYIRYQSAATTTGINITLVYSGTVTNSDFQLISNETATTNTIRWNRSTANVATIASQGALAAATNYVQIKGWIETSTTGILKLQFASEVAVSAITVQAGSWGECQEVQAT